MQANALSLPIDKSRGFSRVSVSEYYNDEVLDRWAKANPRLAYPEDDADEEEDEE